MARATDRSPLDAERWDAEEILRRVQELGVRFVDLQFTDIVGMVKSVTVTVKQLPRVLAEGIWFDGSSIEGFARVSESDMFLVPVLETFAVIPWENDQHTTARLICNVHTPDGEPFMGAPRAALIRALGEAHDLGYSYRIGPELEFFLFERNDRNEPDVLRKHDEAGYFDATADRAVLVRQDMITALEAFGIEVEAPPNTRSTFTMARRCVRPTTPSPSSTCSRRSPSSTDSMPPLCPSHSMASLVRACTFTKAWPTSRRARTPLPIPRRPTAYQRWRGSSSPGSWPMPAACAPCSRRW